MVGGVIEKIEVGSKHTLLKVRGVNHDRHILMNVGIVHTDLPLQTGDEVWWQSRKLMWTPQDRSRQDVQIERVGYSYAAK